MASFFDFRHNRKQNQRDLLSSLIFQLSARSGAFHHIFSIPIWITVKDHTSDDALFPHLAHPILARSSLSVLLRLDDRINKDSITNFSLADYAARYWFVHGQFENVSLTIREDMERLFDRERPHFAAWVWPHDVDEPLREPTLTKQPECPDAQPTYYAVLRGLLWLIEPLNATYPCDVGSRGGSHGHIRPHCLRLHDGSRFFALSIWCRNKSSGEMNEGWIPLHSIHYLHISLPQSQSFW